MQFPHALCKQAGLNTADVATLCDVSRVTGYRWLKGTDRAGHDGVGVNVFLRDRVTKLAGSLQAAVDAGVLPSEEIAKLPPKKRATKLRSIINQYRVRK